MAAISFTPLHVRRLSETVESHIRELIASEKLTPGQRLPSEKELSRQFGVSIVTIREALHGLEAFGIVQKKRGKGGGVFASEARTDSVKTILNSYFSSRDFSAAQVSEVRAVVEPGAARLAAGRVTPGTLRDLRENISFCEKRLANRASAPSERDYLELEVRIIKFHRLVAEATGNPVLTLTVDYLMDFLLDSTRKLGRRLDPDISAQAIEDHKRIYSRLQARDAAGAERAMLKHLGLTEGYLVDKERTGSR